MLEISLDSDSYSTFLFAMRSPKTKEKVMGRLRMFFDFIGIPEGNMDIRCNTFVNKAKEDQAWVFGCLVKYLESLKERYDNKEISAGTIKNRYQAIKLFCDMSDISIPWKRISRALPKVRKYANDRAPTLEEIRKLIDYPDRRIKSIIYTMASSGIRVGAWDYLKWRHIIPIEKKGRIVAAKIIIYGGEDDEHFSFLTPEAYRELDKWRIFRKMSGEVVDDDSWVLRNLWNTKNGYSKGLVSIPVKLKSEGVRSLIKEALYAQGIRKKLLPGQKRHEFQTDHGFRKWFKTRCELSGMKPINIEILMNHSCGISDSYYRATEEEILFDYLHAIDNLTIEKEQKLNAEIEKIKEKSGETEFAINKKLKEKDQRIIALEEQVYDLVQSQKEIRDYLKYPAKLVRIASDS